MTVWALIPCSKSKWSEPMEAGRLYTKSALFRGAMAEARAQGQEVIILSAKYGAITPDTVIEPYDQTLKGATKEVKLHWTYGVLAALADTIDARTDRVVSYLGKDYGEYLLPELRAWHIPVDEPLKGKSQGARLHWFAERRRSA